MNTVYLIEQAHEDDFENHPSQAFYYAPCGFAETKAEAESIVITGGTCVGNWVSTSRGAPRFRYRELKRLPCSTS